MGICFTSLKQVSVGDIIPIFAWCSIGTFLPIPVCDGVETSFNMWQNKHLGSESLTPEEGRWRAHQSLASLRRGGRDNSALYRHPPSGGSPLQVNFNGPKTATNRRNGSNNCIVFNAFYHFHDFKIHSNSIHALVTWVESAKND